MVSRRGLLLWLLIVMALAGAGALSASGLLLALLASLAGLAVAAGAGYGATELVRLFNRS